MQLYPKTRRSLPTNIQRQFLGINRLDPFSIQDTQASDMQNVSSTISQYPTIQTRPGFTLIGLALAARILGLFSWENVELNAISNGAWYSLVTGTWTSRKTGLNASANWSFANFKGGFSVMNLVGANGVDAVQTYDGTTVSALTGAPAGGNFIETYAERLWCAVGNILYGSEFRVATNWTTITGSDTDPVSIMIETNNGETITAVKSDGP